MSVCELVFVIFSCNKNKSKSSSLYGLLTAWILSLLLSQIVSRIAINSLILEILNTVIFSESINSVEQFSCKQESPLH